MVFLSSSSSAPRQGRESQNLHMLNHRKRSAVPANEDLTSDSPMRLSTHKDNMPRVIGTCPATAGRDWDLLRCRETGQAPCPPTLPSVGYQDAQGRHHCPVFHMRRDGGFPLVSSISRAHGYSGWGEGYCGFHGQTSLPADLRFCSRTCPGTCGSGE